MAMTPTWSPAPKEDVPDGAPRSPYAHDAWRRAGRKDGAQLKAAQVLFDVEPAAEQMRAAAAGDPAVELELKLSDAAIPLQLPSGALGPAPGVLRSAKMEVAAPRDDAVFVGVIDDGIGFAHERFRILGEDGAPRTRVDMLWLQGADHEPERPALYGFGREMFAKDIDKLLARHRLTGARVDEASLYRDAGAVTMRRRPQSGPPTLAFAASHGTAVMDLAAGFAADDLQAARVRLLAVSLPPTVTEDTSGAFVEGYLALGLDRIRRHIESAEQAANRKFKVVIVIALATAAGSKDGAGLLDRIMTTFARKRRSESAPVTFVLPAGNARQARLAAALTLAPGETRDIVWRLQPDDRTPSFVEIWGPPLPAAEAARLSVGLAPPGGAAPAVLPSAPCSPHLVLRDGDREIARAYVHLTPAIGGEGKARQRITLVAPATVSDTRAAPPGNWRITVSAGGENPLRADLFVQRDDTLPGFRSRGRQSRFVDPHYAARGPDGRPAARDPDLASTVRRAGTLNALACSDSGDVETVGGRVAPTPIATAPKDLRYGPGQCVTGGAAACGARTDPTSREALYSGLGFAAGEGSIGPKFEEVSERSPSRPGVLTAATTSGPRLAIGGTSVAAPHRARSHLY